MVRDNWKSIAAKIAAQIETGELAPGTRMPSGDALALELKVNRNVVHRALDELQRSGLVVRRQGKGTVVAERAQRRSGSIALLVDGYSVMHNFPSGDLLRGIQDCAGEDWTLLIADSKQDVEIEARQLKKLAKEADGIILYACAPDRSEALAALIETGYPVVAIDRLPHGVSIDAAMTDNQATVRDVVASLIAAGHSRIGFIGLRKPTFSSVGERYDGYREAMTAAGLDPESYVRWLPFDSSLPAADFDRLVHDSILGLRHGPEPITALFCVEDSLGCSSVVACDKLGIEIPTDLEIATFIDWHPMTLHRPWNIRRIVQRKFELGHAATRMLLDRIASPGRSTKTVRIAADIDRTDAVLQETASLTVSEPD